MPDGICPFATVRLVNGGYSAGYIDRVGFCDHAAGGFYTTLCDPNFWLQSGVLVHFGISRKGEIVQLCNIFDSPFAQGRLGPVVTWPYYYDTAKPYRQVNPNYLFISTEHEDWELVNGSARAVSGSFWTEAQYDADLKVKRWCIEEVSRVKGLDLMQYEMDSLTGHHMFDGVNRANCPGIYWRLEYRERLYNDLTKVEEEEMFVRWGGEANPGFWNGRIPAEAQGAGARNDWMLPLEAKSIELEIFLLSGAVDVMDGASTGKAFYAQAGFQHGRVLLDKDGNFWMKRLQENTQIDKMVCLGYYT